ncbi:MAG: O-antigen ligase family protein [Candidatus Gracilibacteria bacterium]
MNSLVKKWPQTAFWVMSVFWLWTLLNPVFKKYDYGAEWPNVVVFGILVFALALGEFRKKREKNRGEEIALVIFMVLVGLSFVFSETRNVGLSEVVAYISVVSLYLIFASQKIFGQEKILKVIGVGALLAIFSGYMFYIFRQEPRMFGPFYNLLYHSNVWPNAFALFLLMAWPVLFFLLRGKWNALATAIMAMTFGALLLTYSRGAWIAFGGQILLFLPYFWKRFNLKNLGKVLLVALMSVAIFLAANYIRGINEPVLNLEERVNFDNGENLTSSTERLDFWNGAVELAKEKPLLGHGPFSFRWAYQGIQKTFLGISDHPHNVFLKIAVENGVLALLALLVFAGFLIKKVVQRFRLIPKEKQAMAYILSVSVLGAAAHSLIDYNFNFLANLILFFALLAILRSLFVAKESEGKSMKEVVLGIVGVVAILAIFEGGILVAAYGFEKDFLAYSLYQRNYYLEQADAAIGEHEYRKAVEYADKEIELNKLDDRAYYLRGVASCKLGNEFLCREDLGKAVRLNPMNEFDYYHDYILVTEDPAAIVKAISLVEPYFEYVEKNVHFTAYTQNVEAAAELIDILIPYLSNEQINDFLAGKQLMLEQAEKLRAEKKF